jgi:hypothetical protein
MTFYVNQLKSRLVTERDLTKLWHSFMNLSEREQFREAQRPCEDEALSKLVGEIAQQIIGQLPIRGKATIRLFELPEHGLIHGPVLVEGGVGSMFYFRDMDSGLFAIPNGTSSPGPSGRYMMARFSVGKMLPTSSPDATVH